MFHAIIRNGHGALHLVAPLNPYNLQTLQQHVRGMSKDGGAVDLRVEIDPRERPIFTRYAERWMRRLAGAGIPVHVEEVRLSGGWLARALAFKNRPTDWSRV